MFEYEYESFEMTNLPLKMDGYEESQYKALMKAIGDENHCGSTRLCG